MNNIVINKDFFDFLVRYDDKKIPENYSSVILNWFDSFITPGSSALLVGDFPPTIDVQVNPQNETSLLLNGEIYFQGPEICEKWFYNLSGALSFSEFVDKCPDGKSLYQKAYKLLGYSAKEWKEEPHKNPADLFVEHGLGFNYSYFHDNEIRFEMEPEQDGWKIPGDLIKLIEKDIQITAEQLIDKLGLNSITIVNWNGIFEINLSFTKILSTESSKNNYNMLKILINMFQRNN